MTRLEELNIRRCKAAELARHIGMTNSPRKYDDRLTLDAQSKLASDAWIRAEKEYADELHRTPTKELEKLAGLTQNVGEEVPKLLPDKAK